MMNKVISSSEQYLEKIENMSKNVNMEDMYLWPNTPIGESDQSIICERCGASDYDYKNKNSRSYKIIKSLKLLIHNGFNGGGVIDITCGDAIIISEIKKAFPFLDVYGIDCAKEHFIYGKKILTSGVKLYKGYIQHLFASTPKQKFDVAIMLNSYRGWNSAQLKERDKDLPQLADEWFINNSRYTIVTATREQILGLLNKKLNVAIIGKGESDSLMIMFSKTENCKNNIVYRLLNLIKYNMFL